jgi:hypothetical protein
VSAQPRPQPESAPEPKAAERSGRLLVRMPATLHDELARMAEREGVSLNQLITGVLAGAVDWGSPDDGVRARGSSTSAPSPSGRFTRIALIANFAVVLVAAVAAIALLVVAWQDW